MLLKWLTFAASAAFCPALPCRAADARPNIVIFLADDLSWADCQPNNPNSGIRTPNMARLAHDGMNFSHAFVASPTCAPSRAALLTALTPARNGAMFNHTIPDKAVKKWPAYFREAGYETAAIGKVAHYHTAPGYGFDYISHYGGRDLTCVAAAVEWLEQRQSNKPLCLLVGTHWPHTPWPEQTGYAPHDPALPPTQVDTLQTRQARARYAEAVANADHDLGLVYDAARKVLGDNTLFLFSSDNGAAFPFGKWDVYDDGTRTPLLAVWPGKIKAGATTHAMVSWLDIMPTCLEAIGATPPPEGCAPDQISGRSFMPVLLGKTQEHRDLIFTTHSGDGVMNEYPLRAVRSRDWHYIRNLAPDTEHHTHIDKDRTSAHNPGFWPSWEEKAKQDPAAGAMVARYFHRPAEELYNLRNDPWEMHNLAGAPEHAADLTKLRAALDAAMKAEGDEGLSTEARRRPPAKKKQ
jgi:uncharacterized sulfatase